MSKNDWYEVPAKDVPDEGRVRSTVVDGRSVALTRCGGRLGALENRCPHQGGPVGEGSIENGWLRCPWHGYDYDPLTGKPPEGFTDVVAAYDVAEREDGVFVSLPAQTAEPTVGVRRARRDPGRPRCRHRLRHGGPFQPRVRRRDASGRGAGRAEVHRHPPRRRRGVRGQCLRQAHRASGCVLRYRGARIHQPAHRPVRREARPVPGHRDLRARCLRR